MAADLIGTPDDGVASDDQKTASYIDALLREREGLTRRGKDTAGVDAELKRVGYKAPKAKDEPPAEVDEEPATEQAVAPKGTRARATK